MSRLKYLFSIIVLVGITVSFFVFLDYYQNRGFDRLQEKETRKLEFVSTREEYSTIAMMNLLLEEKYVFVADVENSMSDKETRNICLKNFQNLLNGIENSSIYDALEQTIEYGKLNAIVTHQYIGYIGDDIIVFNMVRVRFENDITIVYEEETGIIQLIEYNTIMDKNDEEQVYLIEKESSLIQESMSMYYSIFGLKEGYVFRNIDYVDGATVRVSIVLKKEGEVQIEDYIW